MAWKKIGDAPYRIGVNCFKGVTKSARGRLEWKAAGAYADWQVALSFPGGTFDIALYDTRILDPSSGIKGLVVSDTIALSAYVNGVGATMWRFLCPLKKNHRCRLRCIHLYLSPDNQLGCSSCCDYYEARRVDGSRLAVTRMLRHPQEIRRVLNSPYTSARMKLHAVKAAQILSRKRKTLRWKLHYLKHYRKRPHERRRIPGEAIE